MLSGLAALMVVVVALGLPAAPAGAGDNGDGFRLFCGAGLVPATPDGGANWRGGVVLDFTTGGPECPDPTVSSALTILRLATAGSGPTWSLAALGLAYALAVGLVTAVAAWAAARRSLVLLPALVPLAGLPFSRFFVSTYSEPAGLLGAYAVVLGVGVLAVTEREWRAERAVALLLVSGGGLLAATAKTAYLPVLLLALAVCAGSLLILPGPRWRSRLVGPGLAVVVALLAVGPMTAAVQWQQRTYAVANTHNLVFTLVLPEVGDGALEPLGLPAAAAASAGHAYYPGGADGYPGADVLAADPAAVRAAAYRVLLARPDAVARAVGTGLTATLGAGLTYLPSEPLTAGTTAPALGTTSGEQGADRRQLLGWLASLPVPWLPVAVALAGAAAGVLLRGRGPLVAGLARTAGLAAVAAVGLVAVAVLGDGYFEIAKHVCLAAYLLAVTATALLLVPAVLVGQCALHRPGTTARSRPATLR